MKQVTFEEALGAEPFRQFVIQLADGREIPVIHPWLVYYDQDAFIAVVMQPGPPPSHEEIDLALAPGLEFRIIMAQGGGTGGADGS
jgi:hypothetical protein